MTMNSVTIKGEKGLTVFYTINNIREESGALKWDSFRFYTPVGTNIDEAGFKYFTVPVGEVVITRDDSLAIELKVKVTQAGGVEVFEVYEGVGHNLTVGKDGDIIITGEIPPVGSIEDIQIVYKEVS